MDDTCHNLIDVNLELDGFSKKIWTEGFLIYFLFFIIIIIA
jgi:hypothetical protein